LVCALLCEHATPLDRISLSGDVGSGLGFLRYRDPAQRFQVTRGQLLDDLCVLMGGREAEVMLLEDLTACSSGDLVRATQIARALVEEFGIDRRVPDLLHEASQRAATLLAAHRTFLETSAAKLLEQKHVEVASLGMISKP
jgi:cell division protease FtsH